MTDKSHFTLTVLAGVSLLLSGCVTPDGPQGELTSGYSEGYAQEELASDTRFEKFSVYAEQSRYTVSHSPWAKFLNAAVFDLGPSTRQRATRRKGGVHTGTRISTASRSKYRYEGNRVMFHLFRDETLEFISAYREEMAGLMDDYDYGEFGRDEQLAYWLNLYNAVLIHEIAKVHPIARPESYRLRSHNNALLFDAKLVRVAGEPLSLNDIRYKIIYANWSEPEVVYGFWNGTIGGIDIMTNAFSSKNIWSLLRANGNRYVNSLRGIEAYPGSFGRIEFRVSKMYFRSQQQFPDWPNDLYTHMDSHAGSTIGALLQHQPRILRSLPYDSSTADFSGGEVARFGGNDNIAAILSLEDDDDAPSNQEGGSAGAPATILENFGAPVQNQSTRGGVSSDAIRLRDMDLQRRERRDSDVSIEDVETRDNSSTASEKNDEGDEN